ncbi:MAG: type II toxin-antitoxin system death-on-curing family toxin [Leptospirales bacterium]
MNYRYLSLSEILVLYRKVIEQSGGSAGVRDLPLLESAIAQPRMTFGGQDLYPTVVDKASILCYSLIQNHPFIDGNKRIGHAAMETFLVLNGFELKAEIAEQEDIILKLASSQINKEYFSEWLSQHIIQHN